SPVSAAPIYQRRPDVLSGFKVSFYSRPQLVDVDGDRQKDLIVGSANGPIAYIRNTSTDNSTSFEVVEQNVGGLYQGVFGIESSPWLIPGDELNPPALLVATKQGEIHRYEGLDVNDLQLPPTLVSKKWGDIDVGSSPTLCMADLNSNGLAEMVLGNERGGINVYEASTTVSTASEPLAAENVFIFPNPADDFIKIELGSFKNERISLSLVNTLGQNALSLQTINPTDSHIRVDISQLKPGIYRCNISSNKVQKGQWLVIF
ncbi:MAG: T9SS type A sorting domain-containing protein, partial [Bacteroidota bacterium]